MIPLFDPQGDDNRHDKCDVSDVKEKKGDNMQRVLLMCHRFVSILVSYRQERKAHSPARVSVYVCVCVWVFSSCKCVERV